MWQDDTFKLFSFTFPKIYEILMKNMRIDYTHTISESLVETQQMNGRQKRNKIKKRSITCSHI